jgi:ribosome-associated protein
VNSHREVTGVLPSAPGDSTRVPGPLQVSREVCLPESDLSWRFSRSSGPGGQGVNTTDSRVELSFDVQRSSALPEHLRARALARLASRLVDGVLTVAASEHRSQLQNREAAQRRLAQLLRSALSPPAPLRRPTRPTRGSQERRLDAKKQRSQIKRGRRSERGDP